MDGDLAVIWHVVDTFNYHLNLPEAVPQEVQEKLNFQLSCNLFTRWGPPGEGEFEEQLGLITPDGKEVNKDKEPRPFNVSGGKFQQTVWDIQLGIRSPGTYHWALYLDGKEFARLPFIVNITRQQATQAT